MNYFDEYIKYKSKYLSLKEKETNNCVSNIIGGESYFHKFNQTLSGKKLVFKSFNIMVELNDNSLIVQFLKHAIKDILSYGNANRYIIEFDLNYKFHFTLLNFELNISHPLNLKDNENDFAQNHFAYVRKDNSNISHKEITEKFVRFIYNISLHYNFNNCFNNIVFKTDNFEILGTDTKYFVQKYDYNNSNSITEFRKYFYKKLLEYIKDIDPEYKEFVFKFAKFNNDGTHIILPDNLSSESDYTLCYPVKNLSKIISPNEKPLLVIPKYYWGKGVWDPHTSLFKLDNNIPQRIFEHSFSNQNIKNILNYKNIEFKLQNADISDVVCK